MAIKTNIKEVTVANERLCKETAMENKVDPKMVEDIIKGIGNFIAGTMKEGLMQGVMLPGFGKFRPKVKLIQAKHKVEANRRNGMDLLYRAVHGLKLKDFREDKTDTDETI